MKVNNRDSVDISQMARSKRGEKAAAAQRNKEATTSEMGEGASAGAAAGIEISGEAKAMSAANQVAKADTTDQAKIDRIKAMLNNGSYKPDYGKVADKMMNETLLQDLA